MKNVFADACYWIALAHRLDQWHALAIEVSRRLQPIRIVTTDEVLTEFLNFFASRGPALRMAAVRQIEFCGTNPNVEVLPQTRDSFQQGCLLYKERSDKGYSLTDCISMEQMRRRSITDVLTNDRHFEQEGFIRLLVETDPDVRDTQV